MRVYQSRPAPPAFAGWLRSLLEPAAAAMRLRELPPVELHPTGCWGGWVLGRELNPEGRVTLSSVAPFWNRRALLLLWMHEIGHWLLDRAGHTVAAHDGPFAALQLALLARLDADAATRGGAEGPRYVHSLQLYDLQDAPECLERAPASSWQPLVLGWAIATAQELGPSELEAEALAAAIAQRYQQQLKAWAAEPQRIAEAQQAAARAQAALVLAQHNARIRGWLALAGFSGFGALFLLMLRH